MGRDSEGNRPGIFQGVMRKTTKALVIFDVPI
jgi:hypothetical protein